MKKWEIDEFLDECRALCWNQYTYDYSRMPAGTCNGHKVKPYMGTWHSIVIDGGICDMARYSDDHPNGTTVFIVGDREFNALEYVRYLLEKPAKV